MMVGLREADGSELLANSVARWSVTQDHFFSSNSYSEFNATTNPDSHFHGGSGRNAPTGVDVIIHSPRGDAMEVEIILAQSGGATGPIIGTGSGSGSAAAGFRETASATAGLNHVRIQNQVALNAKIPSLTLDTSEAMLYGTTLQMLVFGGFDLAINTDTRNTVLPVSFLKEILDAGSNSIVFNIIISDAGNGVNVSIWGDGQHLMERNI
jgi:hypothetical protein